jgi:nicotinamidase/pyrazinamidase
MECRGTTPLWMQDIPFRGTPSLIQSGVLPPHSKRLLSLPMTIDLSTAALLVVDVQCGFTTLCPNELPVPGGLEIVPVINRLLELPWKRIDASVDWHPPDHRSFHGQTDNLYPPHCVAGTRGAKFVPGLAVERFHVTWRKGFQPDFEAYAVTAQHPGLPALYRSAASRPTSVASSPPATCARPVSVC